MCNRSPMGSSPASGRHWVQQTPATFEETTASARFGLIGERRAAPAVRESSPHSKPLSFPRLPDGGQSMCSLTNIISALGMFLGYHSRRVGLPLATCCVFLAALLLGLAVSSVAQDPCTSVGGTSFQDSSYNPCQVRNATCAASGPGYSCTVLGVSYPEYYSFSAYTNWHVCTPGSPSQSCYWAIDQANCGSLSFFTTKNWLGNCSVGCTDNTGWYFETCEALQN